MEHEQSNATLGDLSRYFNEEELKDFKEKLEVEFEARLTRTKPPGKYLLMCKTKGCDFVFEFDEVGENMFRLHKSHAVHSCGDFLASDQLVFFKNRKKIIDMKETLYKMMKQRCYKYGFERPKVLLTIIANQFENSSSDLLYGDVENLEDRRRIKKKFDNLVGELKTKILNEDPRLKAKHLSEKKDSKKKKPHLKKRLTGVDMSDKDTPEKIIPRTKKLRKKRSAQRNEDSDEEEDDQPLPVKPDFNPPLLKCEKEQLKQSQPQEKPSRGQNRSPANICPLPEPMAVEEDSEFNFNPESGDSHRIEYEVRSDPDRDTILYLQKDFVRTDGSKVTDPCQWKKINTRMTEREERERRRLGLQDDDDDFFCF